MRLLLDTQVWLWWLTDPGRLSRASHAALSDPDNQLFLSPASTLEIVVKAAAGRLELAGGAAPLLGRSDRHLRRASPVD